MLKLVRLLDKVLGYAYIPSAVASQGSQHIPPIPLSDLTGIGDINDVQERWIDDRENFDQWEEEKRKKKMEEGSR